jgi:hypothetical protein
MEHSYILAFPFLVAEEEQLKWFVINLSLIVGFVLHHESTQNIHYLLKVIKTNV